MAEGKTTRPGPDGVPGAPSSPSADAAALSAEVIKQAAESANPAAPPVDAPQPPPAVAASPIATPAPKPAADPAAGEKTASPQATVGWVRDHQTAAIVVAFALILLYVAPVLVITKAAIESQVFQEPNAWFGWFAAFVRSSDSTLGSVHKVLFPFVATLSIVAFKDRINYGVIGLGIFVLLMFMLSVWVGVLFEMTATAVALSGLPDKIEPQVARAFFGKVQDTLLMYMMLLLGVSVISDPAKGKGAAK
jgi:hypothetical protein